MFGRILDRLFGKRYREGWPRGVRPVAPFLDDVKRDYPELWERTRHLPASQGLRILYEEGAISPPDWVVPSNWVRR